jgi:hypothetical protein
LALAWPANTLSRREACETISATVGGALQVWALEWHEQNVNEDTKWDDLEKILKELAVVVKAFNKKYKD